MTKQTRSPSKQQQTELRVLALEDALNDLHSGLEYWKDHKVADAEWDTHDEMLARWVQGHG